MKVSRRWGSTALGTATVVLLGLGVFVGSHPSAAAGAFGADGLAPVAGLPTIDAAPAPVVHITPEQGTPLNPTQPITVTVADGTARAVHVTNTATGKAVDGTLAPDGHTWTSTGDLAYSATYAVGVKDCVSLSADVAWWSGLKVTHVNMTPFGLVVFLKLHNSGEIAYDTQPLPF